MTGGHHEQKARVRPFKEADPVEEGWDLDAWYRAYNAADTIIYKKESLQASQAARKSGRTREEAKKSKDKYSAITGKLQGLIFALQTLLNPNYLLTPTLLPHI
jgi:hypothetical protein